MLQRIRVYQCRKFYSSSVSMCICHTRFSLQCSSSTISPFLSLIFPFFVLSDLNYILKSLKNKKYLLFVLVCSHLCQHMRWWTTHLSLPSIIFISFNTKKNQDKMTEIKINHPEEKQQFTYELLRFLGNRKYLWGIYISLNHISTVLSKNMRGTEGVIQACPPHWGKKQCCYRLHIVSSYSDSLTQSAIPNEGKHKSSLFPSLLIRGS